MNIGHFGLALEEYAHFTSPIRRYPDLLVHRGIRHALAGGTAANFDHSPRAMEALGQECSMRERRADEAARSVVAWLKCEFMRAARRRGIRRGRDRRHRFRRVRAAQADAGRRAGARHLAAARLFPFPREATGRWSASAPSCASRSATRCACGWCASIPPSARSTSRTSRSRRRISIRAGDARRKGPARAAMSAARSSRGLHAVRALV